MSMDALHPHKTLSVMAVFTMAARNAVHGDLASSDTLVGRPMVSFMGSDVPLLKKAISAGNLGSTEGRQNYSGGNQAMGRSWLNIL